MEYISQIVVSITYRILLTNGILPGAALAVQEFSLIDTKNVQSHLMLSVHCFIYRHTAIVCGSGWIQGPSGGVCYKFVTNQAVAWHDAETLCKLDGGTLATFRTWDDLAFVNGYRSTRLGKLTTVLNQIAD